MLDQRFSRVYTKFKLFFYQETFARFQNRDASLTAVETFAMEAIYALDEPTVHEFADFMRISSSNAAYKVSSLVRKGYLERVRSKSDGREYHLRVTQKFLEYYNIGNSYLATVMGRIRERFSAADLAKMEEILTVMDEELMPEIKLPATTGEAEEAAAASDVEAACLAQEDRAALR